MKKCLLFLFCFFCILAIRGQETTVVWSEDFEGDWFENWYVDHGVWEVGVPTSGPGSAFSGQNCAGTVLGGNYTPNASTRLIRMPFTVPAASENPRLRFYNWFDTCKTNIMQRNTY